MRASHCPRVDDTLFVSTKYSVGWLGHVALVREAVFRLQAPEFSFCFGSHAGREGIRALAVLGAKRREAHMQVRLVLFEAPQQTLGFSDFFFQGNHAGN